MVKVNKGTSGLYMLQELVCYVYLSCLVYGIPAKPPAITGKKNPAAYPGMIRNQIQLHGLLNKSKEKNSISLILLHIDAVFFNLVAKGVDYPADGFGGLGRSHVFKSLKMEIFRWYRFLPIGGYGGNLIIFL